MANTRINQIGSGSIVTPVVIAGIYNYNSGSYEGEVIPIAVTTEGKVEATS